MNKDCNIVRDILPLYADDVCSEDSRQYVENHIVDCKECSEMLEKIKKTEYVEHIKEEGENVVAKHATKEKRKSVLVGSIFSAIYMIPIVVCMIVNLVTGNGLSWFFIVLTSLMLLSSVTIVPLMAYRDKGLWTMGSFTATLLILLATVCIYSHGSWFFIAATSVLFGLSMIFMPVVVFQVKNAFVANNKLLCAAGTQIILFLIMMVTIGLYVQSSLYWVISRSIIVVVLSYIIGMIFFIRYLKGNGIRRAGAAVIWTGIYTALSENIVFMLMGYSVVWHAFHGLHWTTATIKGNMHWIELIACIVVGVILIIKGKKEVE